MDKEMLYFFVGDDVFVLWMWMMKLFFKFYLLFEEGIFN